MYLPEVVTSTPGLGAPAARSCGSAAGPPAARPARRSRPARPRRSLSRRARRRARGRVRRRLQHPRVAAGNRPKPPAAAARPARRPAVRTIPAPNVADSADVVGDREPDRVLRSHFDQVAEEGVGEANAVDHAPLPRLARSRGAAKTQAWTSATAAGRNRTAAHAPLPTAFRRSICSDLWRWARRTLPEAAGGWSYAAPPTRSSPVSRSGRGVMVRVPPRTRTNFRRVGPRRSLGPDCVGRRVVCGRLPPEVPTGVYASSMAMHPNGSPHFMGPTCRTATANSACPAMASDPRPCSRMARAAVGLPTLTGPDARSASTWAPTDSAPLGRTTVSAAGWTGCIRNIRLGRCGCPPWPLVWRLGGPGRRRRTSAWRSWLLPGHGSARPACVWIDRRGEED